MKTAIVTGASFGIGRAIATLLSESGFNVIAVARSRDEIKGLSDEHKHISSYVLDITDEIEVSKFIDSLGDIEIDLLVNNAGGGATNQKVHNDILEKWRQAYEINVVAAVNLSRLVIPNMIKNKDGHIIFITSTCGHFVYPGGSGYTVSKHAEVALAALENKMIIGISGFARSGKDTFGLSMQRILKTYKINAEINAFANILKQDIDSFLKEKFNISAFTKNDKEKFLIRPMLVAYGESKRIQNSNYWIDQIEEKTKNKLTIITDVRYENEAKWIIDNGGFLINLNRQKNDGTYIEAPNQQEAENAPKVASLASFTIVWQTVENEGLIDDKKIDEIVESFICSCENLTEKLQLWKATQH
jgi:hypothetical protein